MWNYDRFWFGFFDGCGVSVLMKKKPKDPTHLYRQFPLFEFASIHASKSMSQVCWEQTDQPVRLVIEATLRCLEIEWEPILQLNISHIYNYTRSLLLPKLFLNQSILIPLKSKSLKHMCVIHRDFWGQVLNFLLRSAVQLSPCHSIRPSVSLPLFFFEIWQLLQFPATCWWF